jgi:carbon monoxide dehydrogenase subunit G
MPTFEHTIEIAAPVEHVFAFDSTPENWTRTMASLRDLEIVEETDDAVRMRATYRLLGISMDVEMELTVVEPNEHFTVELEGSGMTATVHNRFSETDTGTRMHHHTEFDFGDSLLRGIAEPVATSYNKRQFRNHLRNTRDLVEAEVAAETAVA